MYRTISTLIIATMVAAVLAAPASAAGNCDPASPDLTGDGIGDLVVGMPNAGDYRGAVRVWAGSPEGLSPTRTQLWTQARRGIPGVAEQYDRFGASVAVDDFDLDGGCDLAIGVPGDSVHTDAGRVRAGAVHVIFSTATGLSVEGTQYWTQDTAGVPDNAEEGDGFGWDIEAADFDYDSISDLAVASIGEVVDGFSGSITTLSGHEFGGLSTTDSQLFTRGTLGITGGYEPSQDQCAIALAAGNFDGDLYADLAFGCPGYSSKANLAGQGAVVTLRGSQSAGLTPAGADFIHEGKPGVAGDPARGGRFGTMLAAGDLDGDGRAELAVSSPLRGTGIVHLMFGGTSGVYPIASQVRLRRTVVTDIELPLFGRALAIGDLDGDGLGDLAVGAPGEAPLPADRTETGQVRGGAVTVFYGSDDMRHGSASVDTQLWHQDREGIVDRIENGDRFGSALSVGDLDGDGRGDLSVGVSFERFGRGGGLDDGSGGVGILYSTPSGLSSAGNQLVSEEPFATDVPRVGEVLP